MSAPVTARQLAILEAIVTSVGTRGFPPTFRELGQTLGIKSTNGIAEHLRALERKGLIERMANASRALRVTEVGESVLAAPGELCGPGRKPGTHCGRGHAFTPENTKRVMDHGRESRRCRACRRAA